MTEGQKAESANSRNLTQDEIDFSLNLIKQAPGLDIVGVDAARASDGILYLMEVNRSPGFAKFHELTGANLADMLYG
jgi:glutathione synthase/RimK-type ligase-like ATP-grasp enzyme